MKAKSVFIIVASLLLTMGCTRTKPQSPSNKHSDTDSAAVALMMLNLKMAEAADAELVRWVRSTENRAVSADGEESSQLPYALTQWGCWYRLLHKTTEVPLTQGKTVTIHQQIYTLQGTLLLDSEETIEVGKRQVLQAVEQMLLLMHDKEQVEIIAPWYMGYGSTEAEGVIPYTNLRIILKIL